MDTLNTVPSSGTFGDVVDYINANFTLVQEAVTEAANEASKGKGAYSSLSDLQSAYSTADDGDWAIVYDSTDTCYYIYVYSTDNSAWEQGGIFDSSIISTAQTAIDEAVATAISDAEADITTAKEEAIEEITTYGGVDVVQETGTSTTSVMSQAAVTLLSENITTEITDQLVVAATGYKINGSITAKSNNCYTEPVSFSAGDIIRLVIHTPLSGYYAYGGIYWMSTSTDGETFTEIFGYPSNTKYSQDFTYLVQEDMDIYFSFNYSSTSCCNLYVTKGPNTIKPYKRYYSDWLNCTISGYSSLAVGDTFPVTTAVGYDSANHRLSFSVEEGEEVHFTYNCSLSSGGIFITDSSFTILKIIRNSNYYSDLMLTMPENAAYCFFSANVSDYDDILVYKALDEEYDPDYDDEFHEETIEPNATYYGNTSRYYGYSIPAVGEKFNYGSTSYSAGQPHMIDVRAGETYYLSFQPYFSDSVYILLDSRDYVLYVHTSDLCRYINELEVVIPDGAARLYFANYNNTGYYIRKLATDNSITLSAEKNAILSAMTSRVIANSGTSMFSDRLTFSWITDTHLDVNSWQRFRNFSNKYQGYINAVLHTGDANRMSDTDGGFEKSVLADVSNISKPIMFCIGNHDAHGQTTGTQRQTSGSFLWNGTKYIYPFLDDTCVATSDYCNYYRDFSEYSIRVIVLNDYDTPRWISTTNWITTTDETEIASAVDWVSGTSYAVDDIVNYKGLYLKCLVAGVLNGNGSAYNSTSGSQTCPLNKYSVSGIYWQQDKIDWFIDALGVSSGWSIIVVGHQPLENPPSDSDLIVDKWEYDRNSSIAAIKPYYSQNGYILQDILTAYLGRTTISNTYSAVTPTNTPLSGTAIGETDYLPDVSVSADFSSSVGDVICYLHGHTHCDSAYYSTIMNDSGYKFLSIGNNLGCFRPADQADTWFSGDIVKGAYDARDCFNVISFDTTNEMVYLLKVGADMTDTLSVRDYTSISYAHT